MLRASEAQRHPDALLDACTHYTGNDPQSEGSRAEYLFDVLVAADLRDSLEAALMAALPGRSGWDREQLLELGVLFALDGSPSAVEAIRDTFLRCVQEPERPGAAQLLGAAGLSALPLIAGELGRVLPPTGADFPEAYVLEVAEAHFGAEQVEAVLGKAGPAVKRFREAVAAFRRSARGDGQAPAAAAPATFEALCDEVATHGAPLSRARAWRWARSASTAALRRAAEALPVAPDALRTTILRVFERRPFPGGPAPLLALLDSGEEPSRDAAWAALVAVAGPETRARALEELRKPDRRWRPLAVLARSFLPDDVAVMRSALEAAVDLQDLHAIGIELLNASETEQGRLLSGALLELYERGDCSVCRHALVGRLHHFGEAAPALLAECTRDCSLELRADANAWTR